MFEIKYSDLAGRIGILHTNHGKIETPSFVPVIHPVRQSIPAEKIKKIGLYRYTKQLSSTRSVPVDVNVYSMPLRRIKKKFKERHQRKRKWVTIKEAIKLVSDKDLEAFLKKIA